MPDQVEDHGYGNELDTRGVIVHDTATDGDLPFNANLAAKAARATPFKRPENGLFRPGSKFGGPSSPKYGAATSHSAGDNRARTSSGVHT